MTVLLWILALAMIAIGVAGTVLPVLPGPTLVFEQGAQGGTAADVRALLRPGANTPGTSGVLVTASRSVIYAKGESVGSGSIDTKPWDQRVAAAAQSLAAEIHAVVAGD